MAQRLRSSISARLVDVSIGILVLSLSVVALRAQNTATISGTVSDPSGALVQGVEITGTQTDTATQRTATTDAGGSYIIPNLPLGPYRLRASKMGFEIYVQTGIALEGGSSPTLPV